MVYESNFFIGEDWVPQEEEEIGLLEALNDEDARASGACVPRRDGRGA